MRKDVQLKAQKLNKTHRHRHIWYRIVSVLSCITVFITTYALILPAITLESSSDEAVLAELYPNGAVLRCPFETHKHSAECYNADKELVCGYADFAVHTHDRNCYGSDGELVCGLAQIEKHSHDLNCENELKDIICGKDEIILHTHNDDCYDENGVLTCGLLEIKEHTHTDECFKMSAISLSEKHNGLEISIKADEGVFPLVSSPLSLSLNEPSSKDLGIVESELDGKYTFTAVDIKVMSAENQVQPSANVTLSVKNIDNEIDMSSALVWNVDSNGKLEQLEIEASADDVITVSTRHFSTYVIASPAYKTKVKGAPRKAPTDMATYLDRLTDRSNDIGVPSEGYTDSPYSIDREVWAGTSFNCRANEQHVGGTFWLRKGTVNDKHYINDQYWDGEMPFRITAVPGAEGHNLDFTTYNDFALENGAAPNGALKIDQLYLTIMGFSRKNFYSRGNKFVIGEGVTTESGKDWRIYGGTEHNADLAGIGRPDVMTNLVVASGDWNYVFGGGEGATGRGTRVTIRGNANVNNVYGGGERKGSIGINEDPGQGDDESENPRGINVYVEGGNVGNLYGGSAINGKGIFTGSYALKINEDIKIDVSGGHVDRIVGGADTSDGNTMDFPTLSESPINGNVTVNISAPNSVSSVAGDPNRNTPRSATNVRQVQGYTLLNVTASNDFNYFDDFDAVNIAGEGVVVSSASKPGVSFSDDNLTWWGSTNRDGYIGQIRVAEGAKLVLDKGGAINKPYRYFNNSNYQEPNKTLKASANHDPFYLSKSWVGETSEDRRSLSTVAINGQGAGITAASGERFNDSSDTCGLRIYGTVQGEMGTFTATNRSFNNTVPGYSTLEVTGTPIYSDAENYYYYIVADSSANGGKAFMEPEGADYIVCYRYLEGGKIGWYLRERPEISMNNKLVRAGDSENAEMLMHVDMKGFAYEWNSDATKNTVDFKWTKTTGTDEAHLTTVTESISLAALADIENDTTGRFKNVVFETIDGVKYLKSFDYVIDNSNPVDPTYYEVEADYHVVRTEGGETYSDIHKADGANAARCIYDFAGNDELHKNDGYENSVMLTSPYSTKPAGEDEALLRLYLPFGVTGGLSVAENDGNFKFTENSTINAQLVTSDSVVSNYDSATAEYSDSNFAVTIGGDELSSGISKTLSEAVSKYVCTVYSHKNISISDISQNNENGLQLDLTLSNLTKDGANVGSNNPSAVNNGELQIQTVPFKNTLIITKQVENADTTKAFPFTVKLTDDEGEDIILDKTTAISGDVNKDDVSIAADGTISFELKNGQSIRLSDIPSGSKFNLNETEHNGFSVVIKENSTPIVTGDSLTNAPLDRNRTLVVVNSGGYELPATGGSGIYPYIIIGSVLITTPFIIGFILRRKQKRGAVKR